MAEIKAAFGASHSPLLITRADDPSREVKERVFSAYERVGQALIDRGVQALIVLGNDHLQIFPPDHFPALAVSVAPMFQNVASEERMPAVDGGRKGDADLGLYLTETLMQEGFDPLLSREPVIDHSVITPLHRLGEPPIPIVPILQNTVAPPLAPARRSFDLGIAVRRALDGYEQVERVGMLATGAMSHWIGTPEMGRINEEWDHTVINLLAEGKADRLSDWMQHEIDAAGNGANEIRNWIAAAAAAGNTKGELLHYEPEPAWFTGITVMEWPIGKAVSTG